jgi:hypothetical protein
LNVGTPTCPLPAGGFDWRPTLPPVVLDCWPVASPATDWRFTTVASWRGAFGPVEFGGKTFGVKAHQFRRVFELPAHSGLPFEVALSIHPADEKDREALLRNGWKVVDPATAACDPDSFRRYVQGSAAEFSPAQGIYADSRCGWVSDRTACYLASGRPVIVEDTGLQTHIATGDGLLTYRTLDEALVASKTIHRDYHRHAIAARNLAVSLFDSNQVLSRILNA